MKTSKGTKAPTEKQIAWLHWSVLLAILLMLTIGISSLTRFVLVTIPESESINKTENSQVKKTNIIDKDKIENEVSNYDVEVTVPYKEDLKEYLEDLIFFLYLNDSAHKLIDKNTAREKEYMDLIRFNGESCPYVKYEGTMEEIPENVKTKLNNIETLNKEYCDKLVESSKLMIDYTDTTDLKEMKDLLTKIRDINGDNYKNRILIEKIANEILSLIGIDKIFD